MKLSDGLICDVDTLHKVSTPVDLNNKQLVNKLKDSLLSSFNKREGKLQGMAAIQLGLEYRAILLRMVKGCDPVIVYNPKVLLSFGRKNSNEGCLSEEGRYIVQRPILCKVEYYVEDGSKHVEWLNHREARIFCHECDHLDGILLQDKGIKVEEKTK